MREGRKEGRKVRKEEEGGKRYTTGREERERGKGEGLGRIIVLNREELFGKVRNRIISAMCFNCAATRNGPAELGGVFWPYV